MLYVWFYIYLLPCFSLLWHKLDIKWKYFVSSIFETNDYFQAQLMIYKTLTRADSQILKISYRNYEIPF